jgi:hypothetical protein
MSNIKQNIQGLMTYTRESRTESQYRRLYHNDAAYSYRKKRRKGGASEIASGSQCTPLASVSTFPTHALGSTLLKD